MEIKYDRHLKGPAQPIIRGQMKPSIFWLLGVLARLTILDLID